MFCFQGQELPQCIFLCRLALEVRTTVPTWELMGYFLAQHTITFCPNESQEEQQLVLTLDLGSPTTIVIVVKQHRMIFYFFVKSEKFDLFNHLISHTEFLCLFGNTVNYPMRYLRKKPLMPPDRYHAFVFPAQHTNSSLLSVVLAVKGTFEHEKHSTS